MLSPPKADFAAAPPTTLPLTPGIVLQVSKEASLPAVTNPPITPLPQDGGIEKVCGGGGGDGGAGGKERVRHFHRINIH